MAKLTQAQSLRLMELCDRWFDAAKADYIAKYGLKTGQLSQYERTRFVVGTKMVHFIMDSSSCFMVDIASGIIYGNKGWLKVDRSKIVGNAYDPNFDAKALVRDRFRYGHFENAQDGSLLQPIVRR